MLDYKQILKNEFDKIETLISTPDSLREIAVGELKKTNQISYLKNTDRGKIENSIQMLNNINKKSFKNSYKIIYNQTCILAVSALAFVFEKYFKNYIKGNWPEINYDKLKAKFSLKKLSKYRLDKIVSELGNIILDNDNSINFQDLQSTTRSYKNYLHKKINLSGQAEKHIIFYQQCRHVLVHKSGEVDNEFLKKTKKKNANIKKFNKGDMLELNHTDWKNIKKYFSEMIKLNLVFVKRAR